jgi:deazaflavin-dependent oxidoreductase (nitroreductase family)
VADDWNQAIIDEFRANAGKVGGPFAGAPLLILTSTGAKSGEPRLAPLVYRPEGDDLVIFASKGGAPTHPDWLHNLRAHSEATVEVGTDITRVVAREAQGEERARIWEAHKLKFPNFAEYEAKTDRVIPVVILEVVG